MDGYQYCSSVFLFNQIISVEYTFVKILWESSFYTCEERKWSCNVIPCSEEKINLFSLFFFFWQFLSLPWQIHLLQLILWKPITKSTQPVLLPSQQHQLKVLKFRGKLVPFSESLCIIFFLIPSQPRSVGHGQKLHSKFFVAPGVYITIKSEVSLIQSSFITHLIV